MGKMKALLIEAQERHQRIQDDLDRIFSSDKEEMTMEHLLKNVVDLCEKHPEYIDTVIKEVSCLKSSSQQ